MKTFTPSEPLQALLEQMSRDMAVPVEGLVNQAVFNWARLHGHLEPGRPLAEELGPPAPREEPAEPETTRVPVVADPDSEWKIHSGGSFGAPATEPTSPRITQRRKIVLVLEGREVKVEGDRFLIGRDVSCNLTIEAPRISRQHAVILSSAEAVLLEDLGSSNGTWFDGVRIERRVLGHGDELRFGDTAVRVEFR